VAPFCRFIITGHETTSTSTTWALFSLTQKPDVQQKLREELLQISTESPSMEDLMSLPYLDAVVREALRLHSPVSNLIKVAMKDDLVPLDTPFTDKNGNTQYTIRYVSIRSQGFTDPSTLTYRPERWESIPEAAHHVPGVWGNQLSFSAGPRACIGYRFSLVE
jgi:cytochrome P450